MNILEKIIETKKREVDLNRTRRPISELQQSPFYDRVTRSLEDALRSGRNTGIIAEFKRRSPSKGWINQYASVANVTGDYFTNGAAALSVLTDTDYFGGSEEDLLNARQWDLPILRKDFIIDTYQIEESKAMGADVILLIAACLTKNEVRELASYARRLKMEVLLELHAETELGHICEETGIIGINNRDLTTFKVDVDRSLAMSKQIPKEKVVVAESGIDSPEMIHAFRKEGYQGFLIGEHFMRATDPGKAFKMMADQLRSNSQ